MRPIIGFSMIRIGVFFLKLILLWKCSNSYHFNASVLIDKVTSCSPRQAVQYLGSHISSIASRSDQIPQWTKTRILTLGTLLSFWTPQTKGQPMHRKSSNYCLFLTPTEFILQWNVAWSSTNQSRFKRVILSLHMQIAINLLHAVIKGNGECQADRREHQLHDQPGRISFCWLVHLPRSHLTWSINAARITLSKHKLPKVLGFDLGLNV